MSRAAVLDEWFFLISRVLPADGGFSPEQIFDALANQGELFDGTPMKALTGAAREHCLQNIRDVSDALFRVRLLRPSMRTDYTQNLRLAVPRQIVCRSYLGEAAARLPRFVRLPIMFLAAAVIPFVLRWWWIIATLAALALILRAWEFIDWLAARLINLF